MKPPIPLLLHPSEPRCQTEGRGCRMRLRCIRALAAPGKHPLVDYASKEGGNTALCPGHYDPGQAREDAGRKFAAAARAKVTGRPA